MKPLRSLEMHGCVLLLILFPGVAWTAQTNTNTFTVATYNLERYIDATDGSEGKSLASRAAVRESICALNVDVLALEEIGTTNVLLKLREDLKTGGQDFPYWEHVTGYDKYVNVAILSKLAIVARRPHPRESFLLNGRRLYVSRGFAEVDLRVNDQFQFTLLTAHLKSRRPVPAADEEEWREQEAIRLREFIDLRLAENPQLNLVVAGDLNDTKDSVCVRTVVGRGKTALIDTRPGEAASDEPDGRRRLTTRRITWTHFYSKEDSYSRIDYVFLSPAMARLWDQRDSYVLTMPNWGVASDHRPVLVAFRLPAKSP